MWGASGIISGYFRPEDGPAAQVLGHNIAAEDANDPLLLARSLTATTKPLPSFWLAAGMNDRADIAGAQAFAAALHGIERVTLFRDPGSHDFSRVRSGVRRACCRGRGPRSRRRHCACSSRSPVA